MLTGGEDPLYIARRLVVVASEDVGLADPHGLPLVSHQDWCLSPMEAALMSRLLRRIKHVRRSVCRNVELILR